MKIKKLLCVALILFSCNIQATEKIDRKGKIRKEIISCWENGQREEALEKALSIEKPRKQSRALYDISVRYLEEDDWETAMSINMLMQDLKIQDMAFSGVALWLSSHEDIEKAINVVRLINNEEVREFYLNKFNDALRSSEI